MSAAKLERLLNLTAALLETPRPLTAEQIRQRVPGYPEEPAAFRRAFERDKDDLREMGIPLRLERVVADGRRQATATASPPRSTTCATPGWTPDELAALHLAAQAVRSRAPPRRCGSSAATPGSRRSVAGAPAPVEGSRAAPGTTPATARWPGSPSTRGCRPVRRSRRTPPGALHATTRPRAGRRRRARTHRRPSPPRLPAGPLVPVRPRPPREADGASASTASTARRGAARGLVRPARPARIPAVRLEPWQLGGEPVVARLRVDADQAPWATRHLGPGRRGRSAGRRLGGLRRAVVPTATASARSCSPSSNTPSSSSRPSCATTCWPGWRRCRRAEARAGAAGITANDRVRAAAGHHPLDRRAATARRSTRSATVSASPGPAARRPRGRLRGRPPPFTPDELIDVVIEDERVWIRFAESSPGPAPHAGAGPGSGGGGLGLPRLPGADADGTAGPWPGQAGRLLGVDPAERSSVTLGAARARGPRPAAPGRAAAPPGAPRLLRLRARRAHHALTVDPYRVFADQGEWYLAGYCHLAEGDRLFRVDRIRSARLEDATFDPPPEAKAGPPRVYHPAPDDPRVVLELSPGGRLGCLEQ